MFNVRVKKFFDSEQVQVFSHRVYSAGERSNKKFNPDTGEIYALQTGYLLDVPFEEEELTRVHDMPDLNWSAYKSYMRTKKVIYDIARSNQWEWFFTLTFSPDKVNRYDFNACSSKVSYWLNRMRKKCPDMVYLVVPEQHKDGAFHFHALASHCWQLDFSFSGVYDKSNRPVFNIGKYHFGFSTATRVTDSKRAASYLCKYITKDLCAVSMNRKRYWVSRNASRPEVIEIDLDGTEEERLFEIIGSSDVSSVKKVSTTFLDVTYIEVQSMRQTH